MCDFELLTELKDCIVTGLYNRIPNHLKFSEQMATLVMKIYSFAPVDRFSIIKWLTLKWLLENEFNLKWQNNASTLSTIEDLSIVQLKATDLFNLEFKGLECSCVFINFSNTSEPEYRINLTPGNGDTLNIKILKKFVPLFEPKCEPTAAEEFFVRELNLRFATVIHARLISPLLHGVPLASPHTTEGPSLSGFPEIVDSNLATTPPPLPPPDVQPSSLQEMNSRARSRSPLARPPLTPDVQIDD